MFDEKLIRKIITLGLNLLTIYTIILLVVVYIDIKNNPEFYNVIEKPLGFTEGLNYMQKESWEQRASTTEQCKPFLKILYWANWFKPVVFGSVAFLLLDIALRRKEQIKKIIPKEDNEESEES